LPLLPRAFFYSSTRRHTSFSRDWSSDVCSSDLGETHVQKQLWTLAEQATPFQRVDAYTQAMMDLGATVCTRSKPLCHECPLATRSEERRVAKEGTTPASTSGFTLGSCS